MVFRLVVCFLSLIVDFGAAHGMDSLEGAMSQKLKPSGKDTYVFLGENDAHITALVLHSEVFDKISSAGEVFLNANVPLKGRVEYKKVSKGTSRRLEFLSSKGWTSIDIDVNGTGVKYLSVRGTAISKDGTTLPYQEGTYGKTFFSFDTCNLNATYIVRIVIDLTKTPKDLFENGILIHGAFRLVPFEGFMGASLKPMGEGKYKSPLLLISSIGGGEVIRLVTWRGKRIAETEFIPFPDYVGYRGQLLARVPLRSEVLKGGKGVFEIFLPGIWVGYSACFELRAMRQYSGGYRR